MTRHGFIWSLLALFGLRTEKEYPRLKFVDFNGPLEHRKRATGGFEQQLKFQAAKDALEDRFRSWGGDVVSRQFPGRYL